MSLTVRAIEAIMGLDYHELSKVVLLSSGTGVGFLETLPLPLMLSPPQLGYGFVFASILVQQVLFAFRPKQVINQIAGYEAVELEIGERSSIPKALAARRFRDVLGLAAEERRIVLMPVSLISARLARVSACNRSTS